VISIRLRLIATILVIRTHCIDTEAHNTAFALSEMSTGDFIILIIMHSANGR
jgi:hypothetical protein